jgi:hypothetical protein
VAPKSFLVLGGANDRAVLAFLRALTMCGERAHIVARTPADRVLRTRYRDDVEVIREDNSLSLSLLTSWFEHIRAMGVDGKLVILPSSEYLNHFLLEHRTAIEALGAEVPLVDNRTYDLLTGKQSSTEFFASKGLRVPRQYSSLAEAQLPMVAKPIRNVGSKGLTLYPMLLRTNRELEAFRTRDDVSDFFLQEFVEGESLYLLFYLARDLKTSFAWSQRNLLQQPQGKSMLLAEADEMHQSPEAARILGILREVGFHGLGMIELIFSNRGPVFIEKTPRPWGPIQFCLDQQQPLLQAFVGDCLHDDPHRFTGVAGRKRRSHYIWLGGLLETLASGERPDWHCPPLSLARLLRIGVGNDIYLRADSWRCFLFDIAQGSRRVLHGSH